MTVRIRLEPFHQHRAAAIASELVDAGFASLLAHQHEHYLALDEHHIAINTNPTGTGKTLAAMLELVRPRGQSPDAGTLFIAPTNELIGQHETDVREFARRHGLPHLVVRVTAETISRVQRALGHGTRRGEALHAIIRNPRDPRIAHCLGLDGTLDERRPRVVVTNPDLFYLMLQGRYGRLDTANLLYEMIGGFRYVVVDEFHYYTPKQAAAFFFHIALLHRFGFFDDGRMSFLTATPEPEVDRFFDNLAQSGVRVARVVPERAAADGPNAVRVTAPVEVEFVSSDWGLASSVSSRVEHIRTLRRDGRDVAVISDSLADVAAAARPFRPDEYATLTGAVAPVFRREATRHPLIFATPTVDIGYNFPRENKDRQGLDDVIFTARRRDEFWQRLGRAGRVLGRPDRSTLSTALAVVPPAVLERLANADVDCQSFERETLDELLVERGVFEPRRQFWNYVATEGFFETANSLTHIRGMLTEQNRCVVEEVHDRVAAIFQAHKAPRWKQAAARVYRLRSFDAERRSLDDGRPQYPAMLLREFAAERRKRQPTADGCDESAIEEQAKTYADGDVEKLRSAVQTTQTLRFEYERFVRAEHAAIQGVFSFRDAYGSVDAVALDPHGLLHPSQRVLVYDVEFLIGKCEISVFRDRRHFRVAAAEARIDLDQEPMGDAKAPVYVRIDGLREQLRRLRIEFDLDVDDLRLFEAFDTDRVRAFTGLRLGASSSDGQVRQRVPLDGKLIGLQSDEFIPMLVLSPVTEGRILSELNRAGFYSRTLRVMSGDAEKEFRAVLGSAAYYVARWAYGMRVAVERRSPSERYESYYIT